MGQTISKTVAIAEILKITVDTQTGAEVVGEEEVGVIVVLIMKEVEVVVVVEAIAVAMEGWAMVDPGVVATKAQSKDA
ncbi:uncharacterized protein LOC120194048 isoform X2 [Hibiscus syriacus]|uniref:uncharacterized protein LOC120194048 isoform X2 n=1 Tax=Hibiscus syriacus TaxID=106335 RepID=UPI0019208792|nr:uncharacterized protein LOC120194048 isoform X2 [Hibiscus syriacus]